MKMTVGDLKKKLEGVDDSLELVVLGHFGEGVPVESWGWTKMRNVNVEGGEPYSDVFEVPFTSIGEEPY